jgi:hypothetical protein
MGSARRVRAYRPGDIRRVAEDNNRAYLLDFMRKSGYFRGLGPGSRVASRHESGPLWSAKEFRMKRAALTSSTVVVMALFSASLLAQSSPRESGPTRHGGGGGERSGGAVPRGSGDSGGNSGSSVTSSGSGSSSSASAPASGGGVAGSRHGREGASSRTAPERRHGSTASSSTGSARSRVAPSGSEPNSIGPADREAPQYARPRGDRPSVSTAVPRSTVPVGPVYPVYPVYPGYGYGIYYPGYWGFSSFYYDPWFWGGYGYPYGGYYGGYGSGGGYSGSAYYGDYGKLRLKVKPREAQVYVDGYFSGVVDQFDGVFQRLTLKAGGHRIEIRADGFQTLSFEVLIVPNETLTYSGELKPGP